MGLVRTSGVSLMSNLFKYMPGVSEGITLQQTVSVPLTYDEFLSDDTTALARNGDGQHLTDLGFLGNGSDSRYSYTMPGWAGVGGVNMYIQASIRPLYATRNTTFNRDVVVSLGNGSQPSFQFAIVPDDSDIDGFQVAFRGREDGNPSDTTYKMGRKDWRFEGQYPDLDVDGYAARPQSILFNESDDGYLVLAHYEDQKSVFHKISSDGELLDFYVFNAASHFSSLARSSSGDVYTVDYTSGKLYEIDTALSESAGFLVSKLIYDMSAITQLGSIEFVTVGVTEYLLAAQYLTSGTPYIYVIPITEITNGGSFATGDRYKRFVIEERNQGLTWDGTTLYVSGNRFTADVTATGVIYTYDIEGAILNDADGSSLTYGATTWDAPTQYVEDIDFDSTGRLWTLTEGSNSVGDQDGFLSMWSTGFATQENVYSSYYNGTTILLKINNKTFDEYNFDNAINSSKLEIGGPSPSVAVDGFFNGYYIGYTRNIFFSNGQITDAEYDAVVAGTTYEPNTLTKVELSLTNPGAESGTTGWTDETGGLATRSSNPAPYAGSAYFSGGSNLQTVSTQAADILTATGLTQSELNGKTAWCRVDWHQAAFDGSDTDTGSMGIAFIDNSVEGSRLYQEEINTATQDWWQRGFSYSHVDGVDEIKLVYKADRLIGTNLDCYVDDIKAYVYYQ
jgi:hypothetical protein